MALSATISLSPSGPLIVEQQVTATVTVSNSGGSNVSILEIDPVIKFTGNSQAKDGSSVGAGKCFISNPVVLAGGSSTFLFSLVFHEPSINFGGSAGTYDVSCNIIPIGTTTFSPTSPATMQVNPVPNEASTP